MKKLFLFLNKLPNDKLLHFFWSFIALVALDTFLSDITSYIVLVVMALLKELVWDLMLGKGNCSFLDFIFSISPIGMILLLNIL